MYRTEHIHYLAKLPVLVVGSVHDSHPDPRIAHAAAPVTSAFPPPALLAVAFANPATVIAAARFVPGAGAGGGGREGRRGC